MPTYECLKCNKNQVKREDRVFNTRKAVRRHVMKEHKSEIDINGKSKDGTVLSRYYTTKEDRVMSVAINEQNTQPIITKQ